MFLGTPRSSAASPGLASPAGSSVGVGATPMTVMSTGGMSTGAATDASGQGGVTQHYLWGTQVNADDVTGAFRRLLGEFKRSEADEVPLYARRLEEAVLTEARDLPVDCEHLRAFEPTRGLYTTLVRFPAETVMLMDHVVELELAAIRRALEETGAVEPVPEGGEVPEVQVRPFNLGEQHQLRLLSPSDIDTMVSVRGMVIRCSPVIPDMRVAVLQCRTCGGTYQGEVSDQEVDEPKACVSCGAKRSYAIAHNECKFDDKQLIKLQETPDAIPEGETPHTLSLYAYEDLVDVCKPGDRVEMTGIYRAVGARENPRMRRLMTVYRTFVDIVHVRKVESDRLRMEDPDAAADSDYFTSFREAGEGEREEEERRARVEAMGRDPRVYEKLVESIAPSIWRLDDVKKGVLCMLAGGKAKRSTTGAMGNLRGDINVLLCGDPGTSKSQLLGYVHKLSPRGIYTSGKGSSAVGLTAYVTKDPDTRELVLESGALVLSDRGVCCIDEFDKMSDATRSVLHEAMEQQTISVAKAGIICTLNARTSILASANPVESRYNPNLSVVQNLQLPPSLLSRFDLIYLVLDKPDVETDRQLARHLVSLYFRDADSTRADPPYSLSQVAEYISHVRQHVLPDITDAAVDVLVRGYVDMRKLGAAAGAGRKVVTATPRQLESLIRLAEAHAKLRFSTAVEERDVKEALRLMDVATQRAAVDPRTGTIDMDLISTGHSASGAQDAEEMATAMRTLLRQRRGSRITVTELAASLSASGRDVSEDEARVVANMLAQEGMGAWTNEAEQHTLIVSR